VCVVGSQQGKSNDRPTHSVKFIISFFLSSSPFSFLKAFELTLASKPKKLFVAASL
jgi:hypothetical protein